MPCLKFETPLYWGTVSPVTAFLPLVKAQLTDVDLYVKEPRKAAAL